ncbi:uncharacterized protein LOC114250149 [Bombyx mandarina]|uniref:Uncharacterized protein LOC114250149 n=1 Tax=Bombyx mandarina TaxID=7092 RepID=A0A6J2KCM8_BOMMA|nr:uncharacterized protein LOC114250149 [Bombyx mandarina]
MQSLNDLNNDMNSNIIIVLFWVNQFMSLSNTEVLTISTKGCTIPSFANNEKTIIALNESKINFSCPSFRRLIDANKTHIWVIKDAFEEFNIWNENSFYCCYRSFSAINNISNIVYKDCRQFSKIIKAEDDFVRIQCYYEDDRVFEDFFLFHIEDATKQHALIDKNLFNVIIIGLESVSRMNFHRTMRLTSKYLEDHGAVEFFGYNKVGDNSFPNLFPVLTGKSFKYLKRKLRNEFEQWNFIWDDYKKAGFNTAMGSDSIAGLLGSYEYNWEKIPTDNYLQPFMFEARHMFHDKQYNYHKCLGDKLLYKILLDYISDITIKLKSVRLFGLFWEESISHDDLKLPHIMDEDYLNLMKKIEFIGSLRNTVIIFFSDHGKRWGKFVETKQGRLEERLPLLTIMLPETFKRRYTLAFKNLQQNSRGLTTPFDFHETLLDLLNITKLENHVIRERMSVSNQNDKVSSLFLPISSRRTCKDVGILQHWCSCYNGRSLRTDSKDSILAGQYMISHINNLLKSYHQCKKLRLKKILSANVEKHTNEEIFRVIVKSSPGSGIFESTMYRVQQQWIISDIITRLSLYRNESSCVNNEIIKMYCLCK